MSVSSAAAVLGRLRADATRGVTIADEPAGKSLLEAIGISVPPGRIVTDGYEAAEAARALGTPVAAKAVLTDVAHKAERGGVHGPLTTPEQAAAATRRLVSAHDCPVLVERWLPGVIECLLGLTLAGPFGAVVSAGLGGVWAEALRDVSHRLAPVSRPEAAEMWRGLRAAPALTGGSGPYRGLPAGVIDRLADVVVRFSALACDGEAARVITVVEINPLVVTAEGRCVALDCATFLRPVPPPTRRATALAVAGTEARP